MFLQDRRVSKLERSRDVIQFPYFTDKKVETPGTIPSNITPPLFFKVSLLQHTFPEAEFIVYTFGSHVRLEACVC